MYTKLPFNNCEKSIKHPRLGLEDSQHEFLHASFFFFLILTQGHFFFTAFRERGREREKHPCKREAWIGCLLYAPRLGILCTWTGDRTCNPLVTGGRFSQLSHTSQVLILVKTRDTNIITYNLSL